MKRDSGAQLRSLREVARSVVEGFGGKATIDDIHDALEDAATYRELRTWQVAALRGDLRKALRSPAAGSSLPEFVAVDGHYKAMRLFSIEDYTSKAHDYAKLGAANRDRVLALADACMAAHGTTFDTDAVLRSAGIAA